MVKIGDIYNKRRRNSGEALGNGAAVRGEEAEAEQQQEAGTSKAEGNRGNMTQPGMPGDATPGTVTAPGMVTAGTSKIDGNSMPIQSTSQATNDVAASMNAAEYGRDAVPAAVPGGANNAAVRGEQAEAALQQEPGTSKIEGNRGNMTQPGVGAQSLDTPVTEPAAEGTSKLEGNGMPIGSMDGKSDFQAALDGYNSGEYGRDEVPEPAPGVSTEGYAVRGEQAEEEGTAADTGDGTQNAGDGTGNGTTGKVWGEPLPDKFDIPDLKGLHVEPTAEQLDVLAQAAANQKYYSDPIEKPKNYEQLMANFKARDMWLQRRYDKQQKWKTILNAIVGAGEIAARAATGAAGENVMGDLMMKQNQDAFSRLQAEREQNKAAYTMGAQRLQQEFANKQAERSADLAEKNYQLKVDAEKRQAANTASLIQNRLDKLALDTRKAETAEDLAAAKVALTEIQTEIGKVNLEFLPAELKAKIQAKYAQAYAAVHGKQSTVTHTYVKAGNGQMIQMPTSGTTIQMGDNFYNFPTTIHPADIANSIRGGAPMNDAEAKQWMAKQIREGGKYSRSIKNALGQTPGVSVWSVKDAGMSSAAGANPQGSGTPAKPSGKGNGGKTTGGKGGKTGGSTGGGTKKAGGTGAGNGGGQKPSQKEAMKKHNF